ncbi:hypothetical protein ACWGCW_00825 [Streptomyces sp. NPDC054933]
MTANKQPGQQAAEHERAAVQAEKAGDPATAADQWERAQDDRFGEKK